MLSDFQLGAWRVQPQLNSIACDLRTVRLEPKMMGVLLCLVQRSGDVVSKEQIVQEVWHGTFVTDDVLIRCVSELRKAFGDNAGKPTFIATIPKRGYRLLIPAVPIDRANHNEAPSAPKFADSIAVLPFENDGLEPEMEYLSDGVAETIINNLSRLQDLRVVPRTTTFEYKRRGMNPTQVGRALAARLVLTGHVAQRGDRLIVGAELIDSVQESQLWGNTYDRKIEEIFTIQEEIARRIPNYLQLRLTDAERQQVTRRSTESREAYHFLLKAVHFAFKYTPEGFGKGLDFCRQAIEADPVYADAYALLSFLYSLLGTFGVVAALEAFPVRKPLPSKPWKSTTVWQMLTQCWDSCIWRTIGTSAVLKWSSAGPLSLVHTCRAVTTPTVTCASPKAGTKKQYRRQSVRSTWTLYHCPRTIILVLFAISQDSTMLRSRN